MEHIDDDLSSDDRKRKKKEDEESSNSSDEISKKDGIEKRRRQTKLANDRTRRYRNKKKIIEPPTISIEEKRNREKELSKERSQRYRDKKRANILINLQINQSSESRVQHVSEHQNFIHTSQIAGPSVIDVPYVPPQNYIHTSQIAGPSTRTVPYVPPYNYIHTSPIANPSTRDVPCASTTQTTGLSIMDESELDRDIIPEIQINNNFPQLNEPIVTICEQNIPSQNHLLRNVQNIHSQQSQHNLPVQTYSFFQQNSSAHREFHKDFIENDFGHACDICDRLWFQKDLKIFVNNDTTPNIEFIRTMLKNVNVTEVKICSTCLNVIKKNRVPSLSVYNEFEYPPFPENLKSFPLDLVTERLISPRILFMQIRRLRHVHGQYGIYGQVINVPIEVNTMVHTLPRNVDDDHSITVHIKRRKIHKSSYVYGIVNKIKIKVWLDT